MKAAEHRESARRIRELYRKSAEGRAEPLDNLLPRLAEVHDDMADVLEGKKAGKLITDDAIDGWADGVCRRLVGITPRARPITTWDLFTERQLGAR
jgi:hypothetical protein